MSRIIKFRTWDGSKMYLPEYCDKETFHLLADGTIVETHEHGYERHELTSAREDNWKVMQFTGMKDRNNNEIYECDIVKCSYGKATIIFNAGCFMLEWIDDKEAMMELIFSRDGKNTRRHESDLLEMIGNIYENPELLK